jgi:hypothetical protein
MGLTDSQSYSEIGFGISNVHLLDSIVSELVICLSGWLVSLICFVVDKWVVRVDGLVASVSHINFIFDLVTTAYGVL